MTKRRVARLAALAVLLGLAWAGWLAWESWRAGQVVDALRDVAQSADLKAILDAQPSASSAADSADGKDAGLGLALRGVELAQGEEGHEVWRLHAEWATLTQSSGVVDVGAPRVLYTVDEARGGGHVLASAATGRILDKNSRVIMEGGVRAEYKDDVLTGPRAEFASASRVLVFPSGGTINSPELSGYASVLRWSMITNILEGERGVEVIWTPSAAASRPSPEKPQ